VRITGDVGANHSNNVVGVVECELISDDGVGTIPFARLVKARSGKLPVLKGFDIEFLLGDKCVEAVLHIGLQIQQLVLGKAIVGLQIDFDHFVAGVGLGSSLCLCLRFGFVFFAFVGAANA